MMGVPVLDLKDLFELLSVMSMLSVTSRLTQPSLRFILLSSSKLNTYSFVAFSGASPCSVSENGPLLRLQIG